MTREEYFQKAKVAKELYEKKQDEAEKALKSLITERGSMGLVPDYIKDSLEFKAAKRNFDNAFNDLRNFNQNYIKTFKAEIKAEREKKRLERINKTC